MINKIYDALKSFAAVEAIALGGSRACGNADEGSDYDVYVYLSEQIPDADRKNALFPYFMKLEIANSYWGLEDDGVMNNGIPVDIVYRDMASFKKDIADVVVRCNPRNGYTTAMWHNLSTCKIVFDRDGYLEKLKNEFALPYPERLRKAVIERNRSLLEGTMPAYKDQILKAYARADMVSVNHRLAEFLSSYFDVIFALNRHTHPGEKKMLKLSMEKCQILPEHHKQNVDLLLSLVSGRHSLDDAERIIDETVSNLDEVIKKELISQ